MKTYYTLGFLFTHDLTEVVLTEKQRPLWQKGKLNGIGGHIEEGETPDQCIAREFGEEVDCNQPVIWNGYAMMRSVHFEILVYCAVANKGLIVKPKTDENVFIAEWPTNHETIENLHWLIELAKDHLQDGRPFYTYIDYEKQ